MEGLIFHLRTYVKIEVRKELKDTGMDTKFAGGVLLIVGTSIGAGMLALPLVAATYGFLISSLLLFCCWFIMTFAAFLMLEVNLLLPPRNNIITMSRTTLGKFGAFTAWLSYLFLLYSLLAAYISGGSDLFASLFKATGLTLPHFAFAILFVLIFGYVVFQGIRPVDYVNRLLMITKFGSFFILILFTIPAIEIQKLSVTHLSFTMSTITVMLTSFGFANIIPTLRSYFNDDIKQLRIAILVGSLIPLLCYLIWNLVILGTLPNAHLIAIMKRGGSVAELTQTLSLFLNSTTFSFFVHVFTAICVLTSFLCVSLSLTDFLSDGLKVEKKNHGNWLIHLLTFVPPLLIVIFYPGLFIKALNYAGIFCAILIILLPALMALAGRRKKWAGRRYAVYGGVFPILFLALIASLIIILSVLQVMQFI